MPIRFSDSASRVISAFKSNATELALVLAFLTLIVASTASIIAIVQLRDAKHASALNAVATTMSLYAVPKARYYDVLLENRHLSEIDDQAASRTVGSYIEHIEILTILNLRDYLQGIELACSMYIDGVLDDEHQRFFADHLRGDIDLLLYSYVAESGSVRIRSSLLSNSQTPFEVPWITPSGEASDELQPYEATRKCLQELEIILVEKSCC